MVSCSCTSCGERNPIVVDPRFSKPGEPRAYTVTRRARIRQACWGVEISSYLIRVMDGTKGKEN